MPGIFGILSQDAPAECAPSARQMAEVMRHEAFYQSAAHFVPEMGIYAGAVTFENPANGIFENEARNVTLIFSGEVFGESEILPGRKIIQLYEDQGEKFVKSLDGLFCGLLMDKQRRKSFLFNDRYGMQRIYFHNSGGDVYFASEAKALLRVLPQLRQFEPEGLADFLTFGCTLDWKTLFRGIEILPGGSLWTFENGRCHREKYFSPEIWESRPPVSGEEFESRFQQTFKRVLPRYFHSDLKIGVALTGGLDTRMIMACRPQNNGHLTCYTFTGNVGCTLDDKIAARVAAIARLEHNLLRLDRDFFSDFAGYANKAVFATDGTAGIINAHEVYFNRRARQLAPLRLTGNYGSEILRGMSTFKPIPLAPELLTPAWRAKRAACARMLKKPGGHPLTFAAFKEIPWNLYGNLAAGLSQLSFRTPYLDNELVALAFQAPGRLRKSSLSSFRLVRANDAALSEIPTDRGFAADQSKWEFFCRRIFAETTFKLDYYLNEGFPALLAPLGKVFKNAASRVGLLGMHKFLHYQSWFKNELADYVRQTLARPQNITNDFWEPAFVKRLADEHLAGRNNYFREINAVLTLEAIQRLLFRELPR